MFKKNFLAVLLAPWYKKWSVYKKSTKKYSIISSYKMHDLLLQQGF
jgi:hypothetical protein